MTLRICRSSFEWLLNNFINRWSVLKFRYIRALYVHVFCWIFGCPIANILSGALWALIYFLCLLCLLCLLIACSYLLIYSFWTHEVFMAKNSSPKSGGACLLPQVTPDPQLFWEKISLAVQKGNAVCRRHYRFLPRLWISEFYFFTFLSYLITVIFFCNRPWRLTYFSCASSSRIFLRAY